MSSTATVGIKGRKCAYPNCDGRGVAQGRQHADGSTYYRRWCKSHLKGSRKQERIDYQSKLKNNAKVLFPKHR